MTFDLTAALRLNDVNFSRGMSRARTLTDRARMSTGRYSAELMAHRQAAKQVRQDYVKLVASAGDYVGKTGEYINALGELGKKEKRIKDELLALDERARVSLHQSVGAVLARSTQSEKIIQNFNRMKNPLYSVNNGLLRISQGLENVARRGQPAYLALKMLGPTANMKQLNDMVRLITAGLMRFQAVSLAAGIAAGIFYYTLHKKAMEANESYKKAFEDMQKSMSKAFKPLVDVFAQVMTPVFKFIGAVADMIAKFNEAHPTLAKLIAGFVLLVPILTLLLAPLAIGIGFFGGFAAAMAETWMLIGPLITGLATMMGTVFSLSAIIVAITASFSALKKLFIEHQTAIKVLATIIGVFLGPALINTAVQAVIAGGAMIGSFVASLARSAVQAAITASTITGQLIMSLINYALTGWKTVGAIAAQTAAWVASRAVMLAGAVATGVMTAAQWALNVAMSANPIGLVIVAIGALIAAGVLLYQNWDIVKAKTVELWNKLGPLQGVFLALLGPIGMVVSAVKGLVSVWESFKSSISNFKMPKFSLPKIGGSVVGFLGGKSHAGGLSNVPYNGYQATLHKGERVLTPEENDAYNRGKGGGQINITGNTFNVRKDSDIKDIAYQLAKLIEKEGAWA